MVSKWHPRKSSRGSVSPEDILQWFDTEAKADAWFVGLRWPRGIKCPFCSSKRISAIANRKPQPYRCKHCRRHFSVKTGTPLHNSKIPLSKWATALCLFDYCQRELSSVELHRVLGLSQKTAWHLRQRIRRMRAGRRARLRKARQLRRASRRPVRSGKVRPCPMQGAAKQPGRTDCRSKTPPEST